MPMTGPSVVALSVGLLSIACTVVCAARLWARVGSGPLPGSRIGRLQAIETDLCHGLMGMAMAGMLIPGLGLISDGWRTGGWLAVWIMITLWFAHRTISTRRSRGRGFHHLPGHLLLSGSMVYMLAVPLVTPAMATTGSMPAGNAVSMHSGMVMTPSARASAKSTGDAVASDGMPSGMPMPSGMSMAPGAMMTPGMVMSSGTMSSSASSSARSTVLAGMTGNEKAGSMTALGGIGTGLDLLLAVALMGLAVVSLARARRASRPAIVSASGGGGARVLLDGRMVAGLDAVMAMSMAYMLVMMLA